MNSSERLLALYSHLLFTGREVLLRDLARKMGCSKQTILRDLTKLEASSFGKLLCEKHGRESAYRLDRPKNLPKLTLNARGLQDLALCRAFLLHLLPQKMREITEVALGQAAVYASEAGEAPAACSASKGAIDYTPFEKILETITEAIRAQKVCCVRYRAPGNDEPKTHFFAPKLLIAYHEALYARGWLVLEKGHAALKHENPANLALQRFEEAQITDRTSDHLPDVEEYGQGGGEEGFGFMEGEAFTVRARFSSASAPYAMERVWSLGQTWVRHRDGSATLTMTARSWREVRAWILGFGDTAELLSPPWLRKEVKECLQRMAALYAPRAGNDRAKAETGLVEECENNFQQTDDRPQG